MKYERKNALKCCALIEMLYSMIDVWEQQGKPQHEGNFKWTPPQMADFPVFGDLVWSRERKWVRGHGPKGKDHWEYVRSPMIIAAATSDSRIFLAVRGTSVNPEWYTDTDFFSETVTIGPAKKVSVHEGFYFAFDSCRDAVIASITALSQKIGGAPAGLVVSGHSLGAALATLFPLSIYASDWFANSGLSDMSVYGIATPRAGKKDFADTYNSMEAIKTFNIRNTKDIIPDLPPDSFGFRPVGQNLNFTQDWNNPAANHTMPVYHAAIENGWGDLGTDEA